MSELVGEIGVGPTTAAGALLFLALLVMLGVIPTPGEMKRTRADRDSYKATAEKLTDSVLTISDTLSKILTSQDKILTSQETSSHALSLISDAVVRRQEAR